MHSGDGEIDGSSRERSVRAEGDQNVQRKFGGEQIIQRNTKKPPQHTLTSRFCARTAETDIFEKRCQASAKRATSADRTVRFDILRIEWTLQLPTKGRRRDDVIHTQSFRPARLKSRCFRCAPRSCGARLSPPLRRARCELTLLLCICAAEIFIPFKRSLRFCALFLSLHEPSVLKPYPSVFLRLFLSSARSSPRPRSPRRAASLPLAPLRRHHPSP